MEDSRLVSDLKDRINDRYGQSAGHINPMHVAASQFSEAAKYLNAPGIEHVLFFPDRDLQFNLHFKKDDGSRFSVDGYRSQHKNLRGPYKGGIRYHPDVTRSEVAALSYWMTIKGAVMQIDVGGGKGGVVIDVKKFSKSELRRVTTSWVSAMGPNLGPDRDVPAPDVYTNATTMRNIALAYQKDHNDEFYPGVVTGKPVKNYAGIEGRDTATAMGGYIVLDKLLKNLNKEPSSIAIQGFGNAGSEFAKLANADKRKIVAVSDSKGGVYNPNGLNIEEVIKVKSETGSVVNYREGERLTNDQLLALDVDVLVPSALENAITQNNANEVRANILVELANGPVTTKADRVLDENGIVIIPDILANAGGVTVSWFEMLQGNNARWNRTQVNNKLKQYMERAFDRVYAISQGNGNGELVTTDGESSLRENPGKISMRNAATLYALNDLWALHLTKFP
jgi:glutamate dehydrogenase/leucine dehydrogenase